MKMSKLCSSVSIGLVDLAEGRTNAVVSEHVAGCASCQAKLLELQKMLASIATPQYSAPSAWIASAKAIMAPRASRMILQRSSLTLAGARRASTDFQAVYEFDGITLRVMYVKEDRGWSVIARVPDANWSVSQGGKQVAIDGDGRFQFKVKALTASGFTLFNSTNRLEVPSGSEAISGHPSDA